MLHNICINRNESHIGITVDPNTNCKLQGEAIRNILHMTNGRRVQDKVSNATKMRDHLAETFWKEKENIN